MLIAGIQMTCGESKQKNVEKAVRLIGEAANKGARFICLQELFATQFFPCTLAGILNVP